MAPPDTVTAGIVGASGYAGGELLRLLLQHPRVRVIQATSQRNLGKPLHQVHPHLRGQSELRFIDISGLSPCDVLFLALPHGEAQAQIDYFAGLAPRLIDLSADFRLSDAARYAKAYGGEHKAKHWLERFVYGLPEINRDRICTAAYVSGIGCNAAATILAIWALGKAGFLDWTLPLIADVKVGSSEAGNAISESSHHPVRAGVVRPFSLAGHRHEAEVEQAVLPFTRDADVRIAVTSVEMVRGAAAAIHVTLPKGLTERDIWQIYRQTWQETPFVRVVHSQSGLHRHPEPRLLAGTNFADVGWEYNPENGRGVLLCAIDNLGKGAAGTAVQCMNLLCGFEETSALTFPGLYP